MSHQPHTRQLDRDAPFRQAPTRSSASGPSHIASTRDVAIYFREDCRDLRDALQLEMVVAQYVLRIRDVRSSAGIAVGEAVGTGVVAELEGFGDPLSHAILRGLAHLGRGEIARRSSEAAARLAERETGMLRQFADVGETSPVGTWRMLGEVEGDEVLFGEFEHRLGRRHTVALFVDPRGGGTVKHLGLLGPTSELDPDEPLHPSFMEELAIPAGLELIRDALERTYGPDGAESDDFRVLIALARANSTASDCRAF
jgi:hypothetical protein